MTAECTLQSLVDATIKRSPDDVAVLFDDQGQSTVRTYRDLDKLASKIHGHLTVIGVEREVVGVFVKAGADLPAILLGLLRAEAIFYTIDLDTPPVKLQYVIEQLHSRRLLVDRSLLEVFRSRLVDHVTSCESLQGTSLVCVRVDGMEAESQPAGLAYVITTSGTTGQPKVVRVPHRCIVPNITHIRSLYKLQPSDRVFLASPLTFDPSIVEIFTTLAGGATLLVVPDTTKAQPRRLVDTLVRLECTVMQITPTLASNIGGRAWRGRLLTPTSPLRVVALGGERCPTGDTLRSWRGDRNQTAFYNLYGITEVSCWATYQAITEQYLSSSSEIPLGEPLAGTELKLHSPDVSTEQHYFGVGALQDLPPEGDSVGELLIGGTQRVCLIDDEHRVLPPGNKHKVAPPVFRHSGDIVRRTKDGLYYYVGRKDDQVKRHGKRFNLTEVEKVACQSPVVPVTAAVAILDNLAHTLLLFVTTEPSDDTTGLQVALRDWLRSQVTTYMVPDCILLTDAFPLTHHGKVDKAQLLHDHRATLESSSTDSSILTEGGSSLTNRHLTITDIAETVYSTVKEVGDTSISLSHPATSNYLQSGGNSFSALQVANRLEILFTLQLPSLVDILLHQTLGEVIDYVYNVFIETSHQSSTGQQLHTTSGDSSIGQQLHITSGDSSIGQQVHITSEYSSIGQRLHSTSGYSTTGQQSPTSLGDSSISEQLNTTSGDSSIGQLSHTTSGAPSGGDISIVSLKEGPETSLSDAVNGASPFTHSIRQCSKVMHHGRFIKSTKLSKNRSVTNRQSHLLELPDSDVGYWNVSGMSAGENGSSARQMLQLFPRWSHDTGKCIDASPLVAVNSKTGDAVCYIGSHSGRFAAVSMVTGKALWDICLPDRVESSACLSLCGQYVIVGCCDGRIYTLDSQTGGVVWGYATRDQVKSSPCVDPVTGLVFCGSHDHFLYALNIHEQSVVWRLDVGGSTFSSPAVCLEPHIVYSASLAGGLYACKPADGTLVWRTTLAKPLFSSPAVSQDIVVCGCVDGSLYCFNHQGESLWSYTTGGPVFSSPVIWPLSKGSSIIVCGSHDRHWYCLTSRGQLLSRHAMDSEVYASPMVFSWEHGLSIQKKSKGLGYCKQGLEGQGIRSEPTMTIEQNGENLTDGKEHSKHHPEGMSEFPSKRMRRESPGETPRDTSSVNSWDDKPETIVDKTCVNICGTPLGVPDKLCVALSSTKSSTSDLLDSLCVAVNRTSDIMSSTSNSVSSTSDAISSTSDLPDTLCVAVSSTSGRLGVWSLRTGILLASHTFPSHTFSSQVVWGRHLVVGCRDNYLYCLQLSSR